MQAEAIVNQEDVRGSIQRSSICFQGEDSEVKTDAKLDQYLSQERDLKQKQQPHQQIKPEVDSFGAGDGLTQNPMESQIMNRTTYGTQVGGNQELDAASIRSSLSKKVNPMLSARERN